MITKRVMHSFWPGGDGSTLSLDFTTGVLDPRITFTRSGNATFINASGLVATAGANTPRFDYDPTTPQPRGLLIEGSATNLTKYSEALDQVSGVTQWYAVNMNTPTVPGGAPNSPYGTSTASWKLVATAGAGFHAWRNSVAFTAAEHTFSFWAKAAEYDRVVLADPGTGIGACTFVLTGNGTATVIAGGVTPTNPTITPYGNGWYRCSVTMVMTAATYGISVAGYPAATTPTAFGASYTADGTSGVYVTMFQTELGSGASSYIPTGASTATRNADSAVMTGANFSSWFAGATEGVLYAEVERPRKIASPAADHGVVSSQYASGAWLGIQVTATNQYPSSVLWPSGGFQSAGGIATQMPLVSKQAVRWFNGSSITNFANGTQGTTANGSGSVTPSLLTIGANVSAGTTANLDWLNACVRSVKFWPTALPNATIQSLTT
jgi:hypothetical protein